MRSLQALEELFESQAFAAVTRPVGLCERVDAVLVEIEAAGLVDSDRDVGALGQWGALHDDRSADDLSSRESHAASLHRTLDRALGTWRITNYDSLSCILGSRDLMTASKGTPGWAREVLGPVLARFGFVPGRKNARWAYFFRPCPDGSALVFQFFPGMPEDAELGGSFRIIIRKIPQPLSNALTYVGTTDYFSWHTSPDLDAWCDFIERALPVVIIRTESGTQNGGGLIPGPGPDCPKGQLDRVMLEGFAESARKSTALRS